MTNSQRIYHAAHDREAELLERIAVLETALRWIKARTTIHNDSCADVVSDVKAHAHAALGEDG